MRTVILGCKDDKIPDDQNSTTKIQKHATSITCTPDCAKVLDPELAAPEDQGH